MNDRREIVLHTDIAGLRKFITGKVRDVYDLGDSLLIVATDRISAFDVVLPTGIPDKGRVLTGLSRFWFEQTRNIVPNHMMETDTGKIAEALAKGGATISPKLLADLDGRSMLVKKCRAVPLECVVRGYLAGSAWKEYKSLFSHGGEVLLHDLPLPVGLRESDKLPAPLFTPATKAVSGHDENISQAQAAEIAGAELTRLLAASSLSLYNYAHDYAAARGLILADTKFEFGLDGAELVLIDEALTPDSSRYWEADAYKPGRPQASFDKQFVRDYLETLDWDKTDPGPELPQEIVEKTADKYREAYRRITGEALTP
jgi:phosphoribosylaminoimidazole-succinocarboxamide synthase